MQSRLVDASTRLAFQGRSLDWSYRPSTSSRRLSGGQKDILRRVLIAVVLCPTLLAGELAHAEWHGAMHVAASRATFAAGEKAIGVAHLASVPRGFVFQHLPELTEARTRDVLGEPVVTYHAAHVQILDSQHIEPANEIRGQFVEVVLAGIGNVGMMPCHLQPLCIPSTTPLLAASEHPLQLCELRGLLDRVSWVGDASAITECGKTRNAKVDADAQASLWECGLAWLVQAEAHEVSTSTVLCYRNGAGDTREVAAPSDAQTANLGEREVVVKWIPFEGVGCVFSGLLAVLGPEGGVLGTLGEEVGERRLQVPKSLLLWSAGCLLQPRVQLLVLGPCGAGLVVADGHALLVGIGAQAQAEVVGVTSAPELLSEMPFLRLAGVEAVCLSDLHRSGAIYVKPRPKQQSRTKVRGFNPFF